MGYRVPDDEVVLEAAQEVLQRHPVVETQHRLADLVRRALSDRDEAYRVGEARVRRLVVDHDLVEVRVRTGRTSRPPPEACPVCGAELHEARNRTLDGRETVVGTRCSHCSYSSGPRLQVPLRYEFFKEDPEDQPERRGPF